MGERHCTGRETARLFVAVRVPEEAAAGLVALQQALGHQPGLRWTSRETLHITLHFLGATPLALCPSVEEALAGAAGLLPKTLPRSVPGKRTGRAAGSPGSLPDVRAIPQAGPACAGGPGRELVLGLGRLGIVAHGQSLVLWVEIADNPGLELLHTAVRAVLAPLVDLAPEKAYRPHITLARGRKDKCDMAALRRLVAGTRPDLTFRVDGFALMESELLPGGARHVVRRTYSLS